jgi:hypothetical protein
MSPILTFIGYGIIIVFVVLLLLYSTGRILPSVGQVIADVFVTMVNPVVALEHLLKNMQVACLKTYNKTIAHIEQDVGNSSVKRAIISRIAWLIVTTGLVLGEGFNILAAVPPLFHFAYTSLPDLFVYASASLFIAPAIAFGGVFFEMVGLIPLDGWLFPKLNRVRRTGLALFALVGLVVAIVVMYDFFQFRAIYLDPTLRNDISPLYIANITLNIFDLLAVAVALAIVLLWHTFPVGLEVVIMLLAGLVSAIFAFFTFIVSLIPRFVERMTQTLAGISPYDTVPPPGVVIPGGKGKRGNDSSRNPQTKESIMVALQQFTSVIFGGSFGSEALEPFTKRFIQDVVLTYALLDLEGDQERKITSGIKNISPDAAAFMAYGALSPDKAYEKLFEDIGKNQVEEHYNYRNAGTVFLYVLDCNVIGYAEKMLRDVHEQLPRHYLVVVTSVTSRNLRNKAIQENLQLLSKLYEDGVLANTIIIDPMSSFAMDEQHGEHIQLEFSAHAIMGLLSAYKYSEYGWTNKTAQHVLSKLPADCPYLSLSFASTNVVPDKPSRGIRWLQRFMKKKGGNIGHTLSQATNITKQVVSETGNTRAYNAPIKQDNHAILLCHTPIPMSPNFAKFSIDYRRLFESGFHHFSVVTVSAEGAWYIEEKHRDLILQVTCFYPFGINTVLGGRPAIDTKVPLGLAPPISPKDNVQREEDNKDKEDATLSPLLQQEEAQERNITSKNGIPPAKRGQNQKK